MRLGISMRHAGATGYQEDRDALSRSWYDFLDQHLPNVDWMLLPNLPSHRMRNYLTSWSPDAFLLTGGSEIGVDSRRDDAEREILRFAIANRSPVIGVCRGFQFIQQYLGGTVRPCPVVEHVGTHHLLKVHPTAAAFGIDSERLEVNSFHHFGVIESGLASPLRPMAQSGEWIEWAVSDDPRLMGIMWHPERSDGSPEETARAIQYFLSQVHEI